jgi:hypothetical protein
VAKLAPKFDHRKTWFGTFFRALVGRCITRSSHCHSSKDEESRMTDETLPPITQQFTADVSAAIGRIDGPPMVGVGVAVALAEDIANATAKALQAIEERLQALESGPH